MRSIRPFVLAAFTAALQLAALAATVPVRGGNGLPIGETGPADAPVTMVVFSDFECPYSAQLYFTLEKLERRYPTQLHVIFKQSPLNIHPDAPRAHRAAVAAGHQGRFDAMAELLFANQAHQDEAALFAYARQLHLDPVRFRHDLNSPAVAAEVDRDIRESRAFGVNVTPTLYVNGTTFSGIQDEQVLSIAINKAVTDGNQAPVSPILDASATELPLDPKLITEIQTAPSAELGSPDAPLTIVEFTDFQCPFCRAAVEPMEKLLSARGREVRWVVRSFPLDFHPDSELANEAALAAGEQGKFWPMHDLIFTNQESIKASDLRKYAQQLNLNMRLFDEALATHRFAGTIAADRALGVRAGVDGTPTFIIDGHLVTGVQSLPGLLQLADAHRDGPTGPAPVLAAQKVLPATNPEHPVAGPKVSAPLTLVWYTDVRSPLAARQAELVRGLVTRYGDRLRVLYRAFPVVSRADSQLGSVALLAALGQDQFWPMFDALAQRRDVLDRAKVLAVAASLRLDTAAFAVALDAAESAVTADAEEASRRGIQGAPVIFLNAQRVDGLQREDFYTSILDHELTETPSQQASVSAGLR